MFSPRNFFSFPFYLAVLMDYSGDWATVRTIAWHNSDVLSIYPKVEHHAMLCSQHFTSAIYHILITSI